MPATIPKQCNFRQRLIVVHHAAYFCGFLLLATGCNFHVTSFFIGCLLVAVVRDNSIEAVRFRKLLHPATLCATIPWGFITLRRMLHVKSCIVPLFLCLLRGAVMLETLPHRKIFTRFEKAPSLAYTVFLVRSNGGFSTRFPGEFEGSPPSVFVVGIAGSLCLTWGASFFNYSLQ